MSILAVCTDARTTYTPRGLQGLGLGRYSKKMSLLFFLILILPPFPVFSAQSITTNSVSPRVCYVLLKPDPEANPPVDGEDHQVCPSVIENLNRFCDEPPQYDQRKLHPLSKAFSEPEWTMLVPGEHVELVKTALASYRGGAYRESNWEINGARIEALIRSRELKLLKAELRDVDLLGGAHTIYRVENSSPGSTPGTNQPHVFIANIGIENPSPDFARVSGLEYSDLWRFDGKWFLVGFLPVDRRFLVREILRPRRGTVAAPTVCTIQHLNDIPRTK